jgi:altronate dehydratase small subunit
VIVLNDLIGLKVNDKDNVAVVFVENIKKGTKLNVRDYKGQIQEVVLLSDIPYGHKVAVKDIVKDELILKYGEEIGAATAEIKTGEHVHVHNMDSQRSRGDKCSR